jgi:hypothetical protein
MAAYGGYVAAQPADISGLISEFGTKIAAQQQAQKEREQRGALLEQQRAEKLAEKQAELQKEQFQNVERQTSEALKVINAENPITPSPTINDILSKSVSLGADTAFLLERDQKADPANALTFRSQRQNLIQDISSLKNATAEYAKGADMLMKAMPDQSKQGQFLAGIFLNNGDLEGMDVAITPARRLGFYKKDPQTGEAIPGTGFSPDMFSKANFYTDKKVDYNKVLDDFKIGTFDVIEKSGPRTQTKTTSEKLNPLYDDAKKAFIKGLTASDADVARVLTDLGGYGMYANELNQVPGESGKSIVYRYSPKGAYIPAIDDKMRAEAAAILDKGLEARIKEAKQETRDADVIVNTGGVGAKEVKPSATEKKMIVADRLASATVSDIQNGNASSANIKNFILGLASEYDVDPRKSRLMKMPDGSFGIQIISTTGVPNVNFGNQGIITSYDEIVPLVPEGQINRVLISDQKKMGTSSSTRAPKASNPAEVKIVTLDMVKQKVGKNATQSEINQYIKDLESSGKFKVKKNK